MFMRRWSVTALTLLLVAVLASCASTGCAASRDKVTRELVTEGPVQEAWLQFYREGVGFGGEALALDNAGNVYASGKCGFTVKYNSDGKRIWAAPYDGDAVAMVLDATGNIYVTGSKSTTKYSNNGKRLWTAVLDESNHATDMAIDDQCNVYVTGYSEIAAGRERPANCDYVTTKYDANGQEIWTSLYNGPSTPELGAYYSSDDKACGIALDASGSVYVSGTSLGSGTGYDYATVKYDSDGHELWVKRCDGPGVVRQFEESEDRDEAEAIIADGSGNIYVTGSSGTIGYNSNGEQMPFNAHWGWVNVLIISESGLGLAADDSGNVYVAGPRAITKYDSDGNWNANVDVDGEIEAFAVDDSGNVCVAGENCYVAKYDSNGHRVWTVEYQGKREGSSGNYSGHYEAIAVDASGNVFVTGRVLMGVGSPIMWEGSERWYYAFAVGKYTDDVSE